MVTGTNNEYGKCFNCQLLLFVPCLVSTAWNHAKYRIRAIAAIEFIIVVVKYEDFFQTAEEGVEEKFV